MYGGHHRDISLVLPLQSKHLTILEWDQFPFLQLLSVEWRRQTSPVGLDGADLLGVTSEKLLSEWLSNVEPVRIHSVPNIKERGHNGHDSVNSGTAVTCVWIATQWPVPPSHTSYSFVFHRSGLFALTTPKFTLQRKGQLHRGWISGMAWPLCESSLSEDR